MRDRVIAFPQLASADGDGRSLRERLADVRRPEGSTSVINIRTAPGERGRRVSPGSGAPKGKGKGLLPNLLARIRGFGRGRALSGEAGPPPDLRALAESMGRLYADGILSEPERRELARLSGHLGAVLDLQGLEETRALGGGRSQLFARLEALAWAAVQPPRSRSGNLIATDAQVIARLDAPAPEVRALDAGLLRHRGWTLDAIDRYAPGDEVGVARSDGRVVRGVVLRSQRDGLQVAFREHDQSIATATFDRRAIAEHNAVKLGDAFVVDGREVIVTGHGPDGRLMGREINGAGRVRVLGGGEVEALARELWCALSGRPIPAPAPAERACLPGRNHLVRAGNIDSEGVEVIAGGEIALVTSSGTYRFNEDAAVAGLRARADGTRLGYLGVFDQAGGQGKLATIGEASKVAAEKLVGGAEAALAGEDPLIALLGAVRAANREILSRNQAASSDAVTTFVGAITWKGELIVVNSGDSRALLVASDGRIKARTRLHNLGARLYEPRRSIALVANYLEHAIGVESEPLVEWYPWTTERGDWLVLFTDGLGDANQIAQECYPDEFREYHGEVTAAAIARIVAAARDPAAAARDLRAYAAAMVEDGSGKADNVSVVVQRFTE